MNVDLSRCYAAPQDVMAREVGEETVILDLNSGTYYGLDPVGTRAWALLGEGRSLGAVCEQMEREFEVDRATLETDLTALVSELVSKGLLALAEKPY